MSCLDKIVKLRIKEASSISDQGLDQRWLC